MNLLPAIVACMTACVLGLAHPACAAEIHKCATAGGGTGYQDAPCASGQSQVWVRPITPEVARAPPVATPGQHDKRPTRRQAAKAPAMPAASRARAERPDPCETARSRRRQVMDAKGFRLGFAEMTQLDQAVHRACY